MDFVGHKTTKIPTLLGLSLLITAFVLGMFIYFYQQNSLQQQRSLFTPKDIQVVNLSATQATVIWWTDTPSTGQVAYGTNSRPSDIQKDNRDITTTKTRQIHFVTLRNLQPETTYHYQVIASDFRYPEKPATFTTPIALETATQNRPLRGSVLNTNLNPIDEALVFLKITGASEMVTFTSTAGNFILPLKELRTTDLSAPFPITTNTEASLIIKKGDQESTVDLNLPVEDNQLLPPLTLGQNINLKDLLVQSNPSPRPQASISPEANFDLNNDSKVNSLDLAIITQNSNKKISDIEDERIKRADLNKDGIIDKKDADLLLSNL